MSLDKTTAKIFFTQQRSINLISIIYDYLDIYEILKLSNLNKKIFIMVKNKVKPDELRLYSYYLDDDDYLYSFRKSNKYIKDYWSYSFIKNNIKEFLFKLESKDDKGNLLNENCERIKSISTKAKFSYLNKFDMKERKIKKLTFQGKCTDYFNDKYEKFFDNLNPNNYLRNFQFLNCGIVNDHFFNTLPNIISDPKKLKHLKYIFESCTISNASLEKFINKLNQKGLLKIIKKLKFVNCEIPLKSLKIIQKIFNYGEDSLLSEIDFSRTKLILEKTNITCKAGTKSKINDDNNNFSLKFFVKLEDMINIKILKFDECGLDDTFLPSIFNLIDKCKCLELFSLKRNNFSLSKDMIEKFVEKVEAKRRLNIIKTESNEDENILPFKIKFSNKQSPIYILSRSYEELSKYDETDNKKIITYKSEDKNILKFKQVKCSKFITEFFTDHIVPFPYNTLIYKASHVYEFNDTFILANKSLSAGNVRELILKLNEPKINNFYNAIKKSQTLESLHMIFPEPLNSKELDNFLNCLRENKTIKNLNLESLRFSELSFILNSENNKTKNYETEVNNYVSTVLSKILNIVNVKGYKELKFKDSHLIKNDQYKLIFENLMFSHTLEKLSIVKCPANLNVVKSVFSFLLTTANTQFKELELDQIFKYIFEIELKSEYGNLRKKELENLINLKVNYDSGINKK
jgi:hypothetical protein